MEMEPGKLFIGGISWDTDDERLREYFETFGVVLEAVVMKDRTTGRARGFGFVVFSDPTVAERVVIDKHIIDGRTVEAKKAVPRDDQQVLNRNNVSIQGSPGPSRTKKIFVGGLASTVTESDFKNYFDQFGLIIDVVVMYDHNTQRPRGFGFVTYESEESVDKVLLRTFHELNGKMVEIKRAVPKESSIGTNRGNGLSRVSSYIDGYAHGYSPSSLRGYGIRVDGRFSPVVTMGRTGYSPFGPSSYGVGPVSDSLLRTNYGGNGNFGSNIGFEHAVSPMYSVTPKMSRSPIGCNSSCDEENASFLNLTNHKMWRNGNSTKASTYGFGMFGAIGDNPISSEGGNGVNTIGSGRNNGKSIAPASSFCVIDDGDIGGGSFYTESTWRSSSPDLEVPSLFNYGFGIGTLDVIKKTSVNIVGHSVANRSNRGRL